MSLVGSEEIPLRECLKEMSEGLRLTCGNGGNRCVKWRDSDSEDYS